MKFDISVRGSLYGPLQNKTRKLVCLWCSQNFAIFITLIKINGNILAE